MIYSSFNAEGAFERLGRVKEKIISDAFTCNILPHLANFALKVKTLNRTIQVQFAVVWGGNTCYEENLHLPAKSLPARSDIELKNCITHQ